LESNNRNRLINNKIILVKEVSNLSEARYCAGMNVDFIGIENNPKHPAYLSSDALKEIAQWLTGLEFLFSYKGGEINHFKEHFDPNVYSGFILEENQSEYISELKTYGKIFLESNEHKKDVLLTISNDIKDSNDVLSGFLTKMPLLKNNTAGYAFLGSSELKVGQYENDFLMNALEELENLS
jgi:phosphoribosylanthranilate isomerase